MVARICLYIYMLVRYKCSDVGRYAMAWKHNLVGLLCGYHLHIVITPNRYICDVRRHYSICALVTYVHVTYRSYEYISRYCVEHVHCLCAQASMGW